jgi:hypothetical protein
MEDENKKAEHRAYARGYQAGRKKAKIERTAEQAQKERQARLQAFLDKAFLAALPFAMTQTTWSLEGKAISTPDERVELAWRVAVRALKQRRSA